MRFSLNHSNLRSQIWSRLWSGRRVMAFSKVSPLRSIHNPTTPNNLIEGNENPKTKTEIQSQRKPRILCLHGFRTSGDILRKQIERWPETVLGKLDLDFIDAPCLARGRSDVEGLYDPPYYEWFQSNKDFTEYYNFEESLAYLEDYMIRKGPFDGLLGFSQGAMLSAVLPGMQLEGVALTGVPRIKFLIIISGTKFGGFRFGLPRLAANAFSSPVEIPSLHFIGERDFLKENGLSLLESFQDPIVIYHHMGHTIPRLDEKGVETILSFIEKMQLQEQ